MNLYFDLDGVLANFDESADKIQKDRGNNIPSYQRSKEEKQKVNEFWKKVEQQGISFWENMSIISGMKELILQLKSEGHSLFILSNLPKRNVITSYTGKRNWVKNNFPENTFDEVILTLKPKTEFQYKNAILIDDRIDNCMEWTKAGGVAIQFTSTDNLKKDLDSYK